MRRSGITATVRIVIAVSVIVGCYCLQCKREMQVYSSHTLSFGNQREEYITVVINKLFVADIDKCAAEIIRKYQENDFHEILFSPCRSGTVYTTVYLSKWQYQIKNPLFKIKYEGLRLCTVGSFQSVISVFL